MRGVRRVRSYGVRGEGEVVVGEEAYQQPSSLTFVLSYDLLGCQRERVKCNGTHVVDVICVGVGGNGITLGKDYNRQKICDKDTNGHEREKDEFWVLDNVVDAALRGEEGV